MQITAQQKYSDSTVDPILYTPVEHLHYTVSRDTVFQNMRAELVVPMLSFEQGETKQFGVNVNKQHLIRGS